MLEVAQLGDTLLEPPGFAVGHTSDVEVMTVQLPRCLFHLLKTLTLPSGLQLSAG